MAYFFASFVMEAFMQLIREKGAVSIFLMIAFPFFSYLGIYLMLIESDL